MNNIIESIIEYVIYARRSREEAEKQQASIPQQIEQCLRLYERGGIKLKLRTPDLEIDDLTIKEIEKDNESNPKRLEEIKNFYLKYYIVTERHSAKDSYERKKWRKVIELVKKKKINGLMGYSPDRFSRNSLEGGELLDLYRNCEVDLKFCQVCVENTASGRLILGMLFTQATFTSNKNGEDVIRSYNKKHLEGSSLGHQKYGYIINKEKRYKPHPTTFKLLREAFEKKIYEHWSNAKIVDYLNENDWDQSKGNAKKKLTKQKFSSADIWNDTFYYGLHKKKIDGKIIETDLRNLKCSDYQFKPMITEEEFLLLQEMQENSNATKIKRQLTFKTQKNDTIKPIPEGAIIHEPTESIMFHSLSNPKRFEKKAARENKEYWQVVEPHQIKYRYYKKGDTPLTITWEQIEKEVKEELEIIHIDRKEYKKYLEKQQKASEQRKALEAKELQKFKLSLTKAKQKYQQFLTNTNYGQKLADDLRVAWSKEERQHKLEIETLKGKIGRIKENKPILQIREEKFIRLMEAIPKLWEKANYVRKRSILKILLSHIRVKDEKRLTVELNPDIMGVLEKKIQYGSPYRIQFAHLSNFIKCCDFSLWQRIEGLYNEFFGAKI